MSSKSSRRLLPHLLLLLLPALGCRQDMHDQPRAEPLEASRFHANHVSARVLPAGAVARGMLAEDDHLHRGRTASGALATSFPFEVTEAVLGRGRERYGIFCSPCHDHVGLGQGMVVRRGFKAPPSLHDQRLREAPAGHIFDVMTSGFGSMSSYASQIAPEDRWAIVAYVRALQLSQHARVSELPPDARGEVEKLP